MRPELVPQHLPLHFQPILNKSSNKEIIFRLVNNSESVRYDNYLRAAMTALTERIQSAETKVKSHDCT